MSNEPSTLTNNLPAITAVISTHNRCTDLRLTLTLLQELAYPALQIIVVDNGSVDDSREMVRTEFPDVQLIPHSFDEPMAGYNAGFERATTPYILGLDDDSCPRRGSLEKMVTFLETHPEVGATAANIIDSDGSSEWEPRGKITFSSQWDNIIGCGFLIRRSVLLAAGSFKTDFFLYYNDLDLALGILAQGYRIAYHKEWVVEHRRSLENRIAKQKIFMMMRNFSWLVRTHFSGLKKLDLLLGHALMSLRDAYRAKCLIESFSYLFQGFFTRLKHPFMPVPETPASLHFFKKYALTTNLGRLLAREENVSDSPEEDFATYAPGVPPEIHPLFLAPRQKEKDPPVCYWHLRMNGGDVSAVRDESATKERKKEDSRIQCDCAQWLSWYRSPWPEYQQWLLECSFLSCTERKKYRAESEKWIYQPLISIITPLYKINPEFLNETLLSIENQIYENWEFCVVDDGSNDPALQKLIAAFAMKHPGKVKSSFREQNKGIGATEQDALELASGDYIALLDHDDRLAPEALYEVVKLLNREPDTDWIYSDLDKISPDGERYLHLFKPDWSPDLLDCCNYILHLSVIRRSLLEKIGGFSTECDGAQDYDLYLRLAEQTNRIEHIPKVLYSFRQTESSTAADLDAKPEIYEHGKQALQASLKRRGLTGTPKENEQAWAGHYRIQREPQNAAIEYFTIGKDYPTEKTGQAIHDLVQNSTAEFLVVKQNNVQFDEAILLDLIGQAGAPGIGAVSPKIICNDRVDHCGLVIDTSGQIRLPLRNAKPDDPAYYAVGAVSRNVSLISPVMAVFNIKAVRDAGNFDPTLQTGALFDMCFALREHGYRLVADGGLVAQLQDNAYTVPKSLQAGGTEFSTLLKRRPTAMTCGDPYYNRNLQTQPADFGGREFV